MNLYKEAKNLSQIRKNQQLMTFYMLFVAALMIAVIAKQYISIFGAEGVILKDYLISLYGLILLVPFIGKWVTSNPMKTFRYSVILEVIATLGYYISTKGYYPEIILILSTVILISTNLMMCPLITKVDSQVINGEDNYSLFKSKMDSVYTAIGSIFGALILMLNIPLDFTIFFMFTMLFMSRYYRNKVFQEVYQENENKI